MEKKEILETLASQFNIPAHVLRRVYGEKAAESSQERIHIFDLISMGAKPIACANYLKVGEEVYEPVDFKDAFFISGSAKVKRSLPVYYAMRGKQLETD